MASGYRPIWKSLGLDFPRRIHGKHSFFDEAGKQHPDRGHVLFDLLNYSLPNQL